MDGKIRLTADPSTGAWPDWIDTSEIISDGTQQTFTFESVVMPYAAEGEVVITMQSGVDSHGTPWGYTEAYIRYGTRVKRADLFLSDIYRIAAQRFGVSADSIQHVID